MEILGQFSAEIDIAEAVGMAAGRNLFTDSPSKPLCVWYANLEDDREEIKRRVVAICLHYDIKADDLADRLYFDGRDTAQIVVACQGKLGAAISESVVSGLASALKSGKFDVLIIDPFVSAHAVNENDNSAIDMVMKALGHLAGEAGVAIELVHHVRKNGGAEITAEDARGAGATIAAARSVRVLNRMSSDEAKRAGVDDNTRRRTFRVSDDKQNLAPPEKSGWFQIQSVSLGNGSGGMVDDQDHVGVVVAWRWPQPYDGINSDDIQKVLATISAGAYRVSPQARDWVGRAIAKALDLDVKDQGHRAKVGVVLRALLADGRLKVIKRNDEARRPRMFVEVAQQETVEDCSTLSRLVEQPGASGAPTSAPLHRRPLRGAVVEQERKSSNPRQSKSGKRQNHTVSQGM